MGSAWGARAAKGVAAVVGVVALAGTVRAQTVQSLKNLSLEELANVDVSSVLKRTEPLADAPAAVYVITHDDIMRSGATTLPEILRLAPNLQVAQITASSYAITARGLNVDNNASMSNKLLVLIDGRSVYTPLFAGVYWDMLPVMPENIDRIEVISGPGSTLWGANAVNGVINIITRNSADTQGGVLEMGAGNRQYGGSLQYGGKITDDLTYRAYAGGYQFSPLKTTTGADAGDGWSQPQGGFRVDWSPASDHLTLQGDLFETSEAPDSTISGHDLIASWQRQLDGGSSLQAKAYYDVAKRYTNDGGGGFTVDTYDLSVQHSFNLAGWNDIVWGAGNRVISYEIENTPTLLFQPATRTFNLPNIFAQDTVPLADRVKLTVGLKLEDEAYTGIEPLPSARVAWKVTDNALLWSAVSRAVRAPTPVDRDLIERSGTTDVLFQSYNFMPETLTAYEVGTRVQVSPRASFSISTYYNDYDNLRSIEITPDTFLPLRWGNMMEGLAYGVEVWGDYRINNWWRLTAGFNLQHEHFQAKPGSADIGGVAYVANDPNHQASLHSEIDLSSNVTWDTFVRYVGQLHDPHVPEYAELNVRLAWRVTPALEVSLSGFNLIHSRHLEFVNPDLTPEEVPRSFFLNTRWRF